jgi:hypothetical protein
MQRVKDLLKKYWVKVGLVVVLITCLFLGYAAGRAYKTYEIKMQGMHVGQENSSQHSSEHLEKELVNPNVYAPKIVKLEATKDSVSGYNIKISTANFKFSPENVGKDVQQNQGHIHIYVNGNKVGRGYSNFYHIPGNFFTTATNTISVTLNANNHNIWWSKKGTLEARANLEIFN